MTSRTIPVTPRARLRWAVEEGLVIGGILLSWLAAAVVLSAVGFLLRIVLYRVGGRPAHLVAEVLEPGALVWPGFLAVGVATAGLYVFVRAGTLLIDHHRDANA